MRLARGINGEAARPAGMGCDRLFIKTPGAIL
jgi:hypothetical protein